MEGTFIDGKYEVIRLLGQGGMGAVYEARHRATGRKVAVKVIVPAALSAGADIIARFQREARASGSIDSPFVVQVLDAGVDPATGAPYMAMECLSGEDVQALVARLGPLPPELVLRITAHACHGLAKAHEAGIVHRDIKSANLFLAHRDGEAAEVVTKILDFGIAKVRASPLTGEDHKLTKTGSMMGSPVYMSPEQAIGSKDLDARSDIFSMGVMMYEALSGATPNGHFESLGALVMAICAKPTPRIQDRAPWVSADIAAVVHKALALKPEDRYQTASELRAAAVALLPGDSTTITLSMFVALPPELRELRAARLEAVTSAVAFDDTVLPTDDATGSSTTSSSTTGSKATTKPGTSTTAGFRQVSDIPPASARRSPVAAIGAIGAALAIAGAVYGTRLWIKSSAASDTGIVTSPASPDRSLGAESTSSAATPIPIASIAAAVTSAPSAQVDVASKPAAPSLKPIPTKPLGARPAASQRPVTSASAAPATAPPRPSSNLDRTKTEFGP